MAHFTGLDDGELVAAMSSKPEPTIAVDPEARRGPPRRDGRARGHHRRS